jgi:hypothetical protein
LGFKRFISQLEGARSQNANGYAQLTSMNVDKTTSPLFLLGGLMVGLFFGILYAFFYEALKKRSMSQVLA